MNLFSVGKIPVYCEGITHRLETRKSGETKVVDLTLKIHPFNAQLASALDQDEYGFVKRTLFRMASGDPVVDLRAVEFRPPGDRQRLTCFAAPDTDQASICLDQVKVTKLRARASKDANGWTLYIGVSFGPLSKDELSWINQFYTGQSFISWEEAEPSLDFDADGDDDDDDRPSRSATIWDEGAATSTDTLQTLSFALLGKQCFLDVVQLATLTDAEREDLAKWAKAKKGPVWPPALGRSHVAAAPPADGRQVCRKCGLVLHGDRDPVDPPFVEGSIIGLDCAGVDLEESRPIAKRGSKKTKKVDPETERRQQAADAAQRATAH